MLTRRPWGARSVATRPPGPEPDTGARTFSPLTALLPDHVAPELLWLGAKWASLVSFGVTVGLLRDVLPVGAGLNTETVRSHLHRTAKRMEDELADEKVSCIQSSQRDRAAMPVPEGPITVGLDGGYVRSCSKGQPHFEVIVGKSIPADRPDRYIGLVQSHDTKPRRRLHDVLKDQGWQENQPVRFMTDGADTVRNLTRDMAPAGEHLLDWFHITMRITVMGQYVKGLSHPNPDDGAQLGRLLRRIKGYLWHGNLHGGQRAIDDLLMDLEDLETDYPGINALRKAAGEFRTYIENNASMIPNYAERHRYGERVSTGFVESTVNTVVGKRFCKRQQMQLRPRRPRRFVELTGGLNPSLARATQNRIEQNFLADTLKLVHDPRRRNRRSGAAPHRAQGIPQTSLSAVRQSGRAQRAHARPRLVGMQPLRAGHRPRSGADCYRAPAHPPLPGVRRAARAPPATHENLLRPLPQCPLAYSPATPARVGREER